MSNEYLWVEKYRPKTIADTVLPVKLKETFQKIHRVNQMDRVLSNAKALTKLKSEKGYDCVIGFQTVVTKENMNDIVPLGAPLSLIKFVRFLVSMPVMPTILFFFNQSSRCLSAL